MSAPPRPTPPPNRELPDGGFPGEAILCAVLVVFWIVAGATLCSQARSGPPPSVAGTLAPCVGDLPPGTYLLEVEHGLDQEIDW